MRKKIVFFYSLVSILLSLIMVIPAFGQDNIEVHGVIKDKDGVPIAGVSVLVPGTKKGTTTGYNGDYKINVKKGQKLRFSFIGFLTVEIKAEKPVYNFTMYESHSTLNQVVVTGYSQVELRKSTGAVSVLQPDKLKDSPLKNVDQLLQGKMAGVVVKMSSGRPGASAKVRIRGVNTITGNAEPLWVIDGVPLQKSVPIINSAQVKSGDFDNIFATGIGSVNPNDIQSITVLKDASAAAIYGSQASGGVIVVKTKSGSAGKPHISYMGTLSINTKPSRSADLMNSKEKLAWEQELWDEYSAAGYNASMAGDNTHYPVIGMVGLIHSGYGRFAGWDKARQDSYIKELGNKSTNWFDVLFRNSISTSHYISLSGGNSKATYYVSGGLNKDNGLVIRTKSDSYSLNTKLDLNPSTWMKLGFQADFSYMNSLAPSNNVNMFKYAYFANPYESLYNSDGSYRADETYFSAATANGQQGALLPPQGFNIMREIKETTSKASSSSFSIRGNTTINIAKFLNFTGLASFTYSGDLSENINGENTYAAWQDRPFDDMLKSKRKYGSITQLSSVNTSYLLRGQFNFTKSFGGSHNISAIAGSEIRSSFARSLTSKRYGYDPVTGNHSTPLYLDDGRKYIDYNKLIEFGDIMDELIGQGKIEDAFASFYGTATYNYAGKYMLSATIRSDGSNNFGSKQQFNANWSLSGAWNLDEETWMKDISNIVSTLSLRSGFGYTGGVNKTVYPVLIMNYLPNFRKSNTQFYRMGNIINAPNPNLRWEKNGTFNLGMNFGLFGDRITGEISYYSNKNLDQVTKVKVTSTTGFGVQSYNTSAQVNKGVEVMLGATLIKKKNFSWRVTANMAYNYNELTKYDSPTGSILGDYYVGYPLGKIFTGKPIGINPKTGMYEYKLRPDIVIKNIEDYRKYENYLFYVGTSYAPWNGGFSTTLTYKRISLNLVGNYSLGAKIRNNIDSPVTANQARGKKNEQVTPELNDLYVNYVNVRKGVRHRWTERNPITNGYPRLIDAYGPKLVNSNGELLDLRRVSSHLITQSNLLEDISYLKLSSLSINYNLPDKWVRALNLSNVSIGMLLNNLFIFTNYTGLDPETPGAVYPQARTVSFNLSLNF